MFIFVWSEGVYGGQFFPSTQRKEGSLAAGPTRLFFSVYMSHDENCIVSWKSYFFLMPAPYPVIQYALNVKEESEHMPSPFLEENGVFKSSLEIPWRTQIRIPVDTLTGEDIVLKNIHKL